MRARLKVCCIASVEEALLATAHGAWAIGLVGPMPSGPGPIDESLIPEIARRTPPGVTSVLLTCERDGAAIAARALEACVSTVQIVGAVALDAYERVRALAPAVRIMQVIHVEDGRALAEAQAIAPHVDALLLDSGRPCAAVPELGGTGRVHDWAISREIVRSSTVPVFLAGGINPSNVREAIDAVRPYGIDLCTGVRTAGKLDAAKLGALTSEMRR